MTVRFDSVKLMTAARIGHARKQRTRPPEEVRKVEAPRRLKQLLAQEVRSIEAAVA